MKKMFFLVSILTLFSSQKLAFAVGLENDLTPESIPTYVVGGGNELVHPDVVYFSAGWNGYKYWMAMTPFTDQNDDYENPSIVVSNDGVTWIDPPGITNPIVAFPGGSDFNADPDLFYNSDTNELWLYYIQTAIPNRYIKRLTSSDGITWGSETTVLTYNTTGRALSPSIVKSGSTYYMYTVDVNDPQAVPYHIDIRTSPDGLNWSDAGTITWPISGTQSWHVNCDVVSGQFRMIVNAFPTGGAETQGDLYFGRSTDGINFTFLTVKMLAKRNGGWDAGIYRTCAVYIGNSIKVWYSATNFNGSDWFAGFATSNYVEMLEKMGESPYPGSKMRGIIGKGIIFK